jgi:hypothetical protein
LGYCQKIIWPKKNPTHSQCESEHGKKINRNIEQFMIWERNENYNQQDFLDDALVDAVSL